MARNPTIIVSDAGGFAETRSRNNPFIHLWHELGENPVFNEKSKFPFAAKNSSKRQELKRLLELLGDYDKQYDSEKRWKILLEIEFLDNCLNVSGLHNGVKLSDLCEEEYRDTAFTEKSYDSKFEYWKYLLAYRHKSIEDVESDIINDTINYEPFIRAIITALDKCKGIDAQELIPFLNGKAEMYGINLIDCDLKRFKKIVTFLLGKLQESIEAYQSDKPETKRIRYQQLHWHYAELILELCEKVQPTINSFKKADAVRNVMIEAARLASYTEAIRKAPNTPSLSRLRDNIFFRKDSADFINDAQSIMLLLSDSIALQKRLDIYNDIYIIKRVFELKNEVGDRERWLMELVGICKRLIEKYCKMEEVEDPYVKNFVKYLFELRGLICDFPVNESEYKILDDLRREIKFKRRVSIDKLQNPKGYVAYMESQLQHFLHEIDGPDSVLRKPFNISETSSLQVNLQLLGGLAAVTYQVQVRGYPMIFRAFKEAPMPGNLNALAEIDKVAPGLLGKIYYRGGCIGDYYEACEFSEHLAGGSFSSYIKKLHEKRKEGASFTDEQKKRLFDCFKTLMVFLHGIHKANCYFPDIKPDNLLFDKDPFKYVDAKLKISDKKSANKLESEVTYDAMCTLDFAAPEMIASKQLGGERIDPRPHDFYALAVTMLHATTGETKMSEILKYHPHDDFEKAMLEYLKAMLEADPAKRLAFINSNLSAEQLDALERRLFVAPQPSPSVAANSAAVFGSVKQGRVRELIAHLTHERLHCS